MNEYYFLFGLALVWVVFAVVQDFRTREVANWLNFSLIAFVLAYRAFYSIAVEDAMFFVYGLGGVVGFTLLGYAFYYGKVFGGGDIKLLMGLGGVIPYREISDYLVLGGGFIVLIFGAGAVWTLLYSVYVVKSNWKKFNKALLEELDRGKLWLIIALVAFVVLELVFWFNESLRYLNFALLIFLLLPLIYVYTKAVEKSCMIKLLSPNKLSEGDWLEREIRVRNKIIKKSVHGLSKSEIALLKKSKKKVWIKDGVPFTPAFLIALVVGAWIWVRYLI